MLLMIFGAEMYAPDAQRKQEGEKPGRGVVVNDPEPLSHEGRDVKENDEVANFQFGKRFQLLREQSTKGFC